MIPLRTALRAHRFLLRIALAAVNVFSWLLIYQVFFILSNDAAQSFGRTVLLYALSQTVVLLLTPFAASRMRHGMRAGILLATFFATAAFAILSEVFAGAFGSAYPIGIVIFAILLGAYRAYYWIPYRVEENRAGYRPQSVIIEIFIALVPFAAGAFLLVLGDIPLLLASAALCAALSTIPLLFAEDAYERFSWNYYQTFAELFAYEHRTIAIKHALRGIESAALFLVWPIALFLILGWSYISIGFIMTITFLLVLLVRLLHVDSYPLSHSIKGVLAASSWVMRVFVVGIQSAIAIDTYLYAIPERGSISDPILREHRSDDAHYVDEFTALKEMGDATGRLLFTLLCAIFVAFATLPMSFVALFFAVACIVLLESFFAYNRSHHGL